MIGREQFYAALQQAGCFPNPRQRDVIDASPDKPLFIIAGPGTGRAECLALRVLKLIFVDGLAPETILALAETPRGARRLRGHIIEHGLALGQALQKDRNIPTHPRESIAQLNISAISTGTPDDLCEYVWRFHPPNGFSNYRLIDPYISRTLLFTQGLLEETRSNDGELNRFLTELLPTDQQCRHLDGVLNRILASIWKRRIQDRVDWNKFLRMGPRAEQEIRRQFNDILDDYQYELFAHHFIDIHLVKEEILKRLRDGRLQAFQNRIRALCIDQYQETCLLHEALYFELARAGRGAINIAGDDDQMLRRDDGATVELFTNFTDRCLSALKKRPRRVYLKANDRATPSIIAFLNQYARLDGAFQQARIRSKPNLIATSQAASKESDPIPVLGLFRDDPQTLAHDLGDFIHQIFIGQGFTLPNGLRIRRAPRKGDVGDCALLCPDAYEGRGESVKMLGLLRRELQKKRIHMFNPWSDNLYMLDPVNLFGGLLLECLGWNAAKKMASTRLHPRALDTFQAWRKKALDYLSRGASTRLKKYVKNHKRVVIRKKDRLPQSRTANNLIYNLFDLLPRMRNEPLGRGCFEVFVRQLGACNRINQNDRWLEDVAADATITVEELLTCFLGPIACGAVDWDDEIIDAFPRDHLNVAPIRCARQLTTPLVVVDVGSDFNSNHPSHASNRFPNQGAAAHALENLLRPSHPRFTTLERSGTDRAFDDLQRAFYTAFSRAREVLVLVGLNQTHPSPQRGSGEKVLNVAAGWRRDEICEWKKKVPFMDV